MSDKIYLWTYWDRCDTRFPYIDMCIELMKKNVTSFDFQLVTDDTIFDYLPNIRRDYKEIKNKKKMDDPHYIHTCHASDYIKTQLLYEYGGLYLDADTIAMPNINSLASLIKCNFHEEREIDYVGRIQENNYISVNFMYSVPKGKVISEFRKYQEYMLDESLLLPSGSAFAARLITPIAQKNVKICRFEDWRVAPINFKNWIRFFEIENSISKFEKQKLNAVFCIVLYNRIFPPVLKSMTKEEILKKDFYLAYMFRKAYGLD